VLVASWSDGLSVLAGGTRVHELAGRSVRWLTTDGRGGALAIVDARALEQRTAAGQWCTLGTSHCDLACCVLVGDTIFAGTDDARMLRVGVDGGELEELAGFGGVAGRETWYAGAIEVNGELLGPPLGVRSISATADGAALLANVHVGGIARSTDGGATWHPTIEVDADVHEVRAHPTRPDVVIAAAARGLCVSRDGGATWQVTTDGLHAPYCSAVAFAGAHLLVAASTDHFATEGAIYRRELDSPAALVPVGGGLPRWLQGITDTGNLAAHGDTLAVADRGGNLYVSADAGRSWALCAQDLQAPSSVLVL
jgi:hypothetical protein